MTGQPLRDTEFFNLYPGAFIVQKEVNSNLHQAVRDDIVFLQNQSRFEYAITIRVASVDEKTGKALYDMKNIAGM